MMTGIEIPILSNEVSIFKKSDASLAAEIALEQSHLPADNPPCHIETIFASALLPRHHITHAADSGVEAPPLLGPLLVVLAEILLLAEAAELVPVPANADTA